MADFATPQLIVTKAGLNAANAANPFGPWVHITSFKIGSAFGYDPQKIPDDTDIDGDQLYYGVPTQYKNLGNGVLDIVLRIPADAGPFKFGEVAIFNKDDQGQEHLFAKAVFEELQTKYSSLGTNVASSFTIHALIKLEQSVAVFKIDTLVNNAVMEVDRWSDVLLPYLSADPDTPLLLVRELDNAGYSSLLHYSVPQQEKWTIGTNYEFLRASTVKNSSAYTVRIPAADIQSNWYGEVPQQFVLEIEGRNDPYRSTSKLEKQGADAVFTINPQPLADLPAPGTAVRIYYSVNTPPDKRATNTAPGIVQPGTGLVIKDATPGLIETHGLVHGVNNAGRVLTASDDLMSVDLPSGVYDVVAEGAARPAGMPEGTYAGGQIYRTNTLREGTNPKQHIVDFFIPYNGQTGQPTAPFTPKDNKAWFHEHKEGVWSPWRTITGTEASGTGDLWSTLPPNVAAPGRGLLFLTMYTGEWAFASIYVRGVYRGSSGASFHDGSHYAYLTVTLPLNEGDWWTYAISATFGGGYPMSYYFFNLDA